MGRVNFRYWSWRATLLALGLAAAIVWPNATVAAHSLQQDGPFIGILHIAPSDEPVAGTPATVVLDLSSNQPGFSVDDYLIGVTLHAVSTATPSRDSNVSLESPSDTAAVTGSVTFPQAGTYQLIVHGEPLRQGTRVGTGTAFTLIYNVRAGQAGGSNLSGAANLATFDAGLAGLASFGLLAIVARHQIINRGRYQKDKYPKK